MSSQEEINWMRYFDRKTYAKIREQMIGAVLATDMSHHFKAVGELKSEMLVKDFDVSNAKFKYKFAQLMFHLADISNPTKPWNLCQHWCDLLFIEFFQQGDLEKQHDFPVSQFYDRETTNIAKSQIGFLDYIIKPTYELACKIMPKLSFTIENVETNKAHWVSLFDEYEAI